MFLRTQKTQILNKNNQPIFLRGVNLGGWLMMEAYFLHSPNSPEQKFRKEFAKNLGFWALAEFDRAFRDSFIEEQDIKKIASLGFNCLRVPFHYRCVEPRAYRFKAEGLRYLDWIVGLGKKYKLWIILDLHAAPGSQNHDWHSDSLGKAEFWLKRKYRHRAIAIWEFLADRYKDEEYIAGYDLLNEAVLENIEILNEFYKDLITAIRRIDKNHILFIEGNRWSQDLECLAPIKDNNYSFSIHTYETLEFTGNFIPHLTYPLEGTPRVWNKDTSSALLAQYAEISRKLSVPIYVGEFGVNYRGGFYGEDKWLSEMLDCFKAYGFHWTYWTYKAVKSNIFPDGIFSYYDNPAWVNRPGPRTGWETYHLHWPKKKKEMIQSWRTKHFKENPLILKALCDGLD